MKALKWIALGIGALLVIAVAVVGYGLATFDPNDYKPRIAELVKQQTGRTLAIDGKIGLTFFPRIGATVGKVTLSEPNRPAVFARVDEAHVAVALWPLLSKRVVVDRVTLKGLAADLVRYKDGHTNFDDLTGHATAPAKPGEPPPRPAGAPPAVDVGGIEMANAAIGWRDEGDGTDVRLTNLNLKTGRLASGVPGALELATKIEGAKPKASLQFNLDTRYRIDLETRVAALSSLDARLAGDAEGMSGLDARLKASAIDLDQKTGRTTVSGLELTAKTKDGLDAKASVPGLEIGADQTKSQAISADVAMSTPERTASAKIRLAPFSIKGSQVHLSQLDVDVAAKQPDLSVQGRVTTPVAVDLDKRQAELSRITGDLALSGKNIPPNAKAVVSGAARADWGAQSAHAELAVKLEDSNVEAKVAVAHWSHPAITFSLVADRLDVDRYVPPATRAGASGGGPAGAPAPAGGGPAEQPFDLSPLKTVNATGSVKIGALQVSNVKASRVALAIKAAGGKLDISPITANLYEGTLAGSAFVNANTNGFAVKQQLAGVSVGPLLRDVADKDLLEGRGAVTLDVTTAGNTASALKKGLAGTANAVLKEGVIKGIDIVGAIGVAQTLLGSKHLDQEAKSGAQTGFTELTASFVIKNGVAHNEDLQARSPVLKLTGRGDVDIGEGTLDYTASATITSAVTSLAGKDIAQLVGIAVPVRATGPLANPKYTVDVGSIVTGVAKDTLQRELRRRLAPDKPGGKDDPADMLKGLFGRPN
jgi:AsmA protein